MTNELQQTLAARLKTLWDSRASPEVEYLRARLAAQDAQIKLDGARQKLFALGMSEAEIGALPDQPVEGLRKQPLRSPISGRVAERRVDLGGLVGREGQESELFVIVDLDEVWAELSIAPADVSKVRDGAQITINAAATDAEASAKVVFISPLLDKETRNARVIATLANPNHAWRPGTYITAEFRWVASPQMSSSQRQPSKRLRAHRSFSYAKARGSKPARSNSGGRTMTSLRSSPASRRARPSPWPTRSR